MPLPLPAPDLTRDRKIIDAFLERGHSLDEVEGCLNFMEVLLVSSLTLHVTAHQMESCFHVVVKEFKERKAAILLDASSGVVH